MLITLYKIFTKSLTHLRSLRTSKVKQVVLLSSSEIDQCLKRTGPAYSHWLGSCQTITWLTGEIIIDWCCLVSNRNITTIYIWSWFSSRYNFKEKAIVLCRATLSMTLYNSLCKLVCMQGLRAQIKQRQCMKGRTYKRKSRTYLNFTFNRNTLHLASILFT